ncbi:hypothetical protein HPB47_013907 [Ixodes persulcatus]|uniref:Uncharacterized protein n=1 Tax=Ixodes persulcatus TaxID=34615 RepID=A0AC60QXB0_IXOPE|nr:hypothetical protein HPB47_013907 [Ixodes persulcatus]
MERMEMPDVECGGCARWCFLEETSFASIEEAKDKEFRCRMCEKVDAVCGMLEGTRRELAAERERLERLEAGAGEFAVERAKREEMEGALREEVHMREKLSTEWEMKLRDMERQLGEERERRVELEQTWTDRLGEMEVVMRENKERHEAMEWQLETQLGELKQTVAKAKEVQEALKKSWETRLNDTNRREREEREMRVAREKELREMMTQVGKPSEEEDIKELQAKLSMEIEEVERELREMEARWVQEGAEEELQRKERGTADKSGQAARVDGFSYSAALQRPNTGGDEVPRNTRPAAKGKAAGPGGQVIVIGSSNVARCREGIRSKVEDDERVKVVTRPGKRMKDVLECAAAILQENKAAESLVMVHAGLNDVLNRGGGDLGAHIREGVRQLRKVKENVHIVLCTIPEIRGQTEQTEREVREANNVIEALRFQHRYEVMDINREVRQRSPVPTFQRDGIHYGELTGRRVGRRMGCRARAFLGACEVRERRGIRI